MAQILKLKNSQAALVANNSHAGNIDLIRSGLPQGQAGISRRSIIDLVFAVIPHILYYN